MLAALCSNANVHSLLDTQGMEVQPWMHHAQPTCIVRHTI